MSCPRRRRGSGSATARSFERWTREGEDPIDYEEEDVEGGVGDAPETAEEDDG